MAETPKVAVLGAGMQGTTVALELARRGCAVDLFDRGGRPITQAGLQNEGKLHLGFVYANDASLRTVHRLAAGALRFLPLLRRWTGPGIEGVRFSSPFLYAVPRDSMLSSDAVHEHFRRVEQCVRQLAEPFDARCGDMSYPGLRGDALFRPLPDALRDQTFARDRIAAAFATSEVAVDPVSVAAALRRAVDRTPGVRFVPRVRVEAVERRGDGFAVATSPVGREPTRRYDHVVNALWDGRLRIDCGMGLVPARAWLWRYKVGLRLTPRAGAPEIASVTFVLGPYGDTVRYRDGRVYLSWYPVGLRGRGSDLAPPADWHDPGAAPAAEGEVAAATFDGLSRLYPDVRLLRRATGSRIGVVGGAIFAWGRTDIDDPDSELHQRFDIGVTSLGGYHSVDTGKYSMAPLLAMDVADRIRPAPPPLLA